MKRRELIKTGIAAAGVAALTMTGCSRKDITAENFGDIDIKPKQTGKYIFSAPMPFKFELIDEIAEINSTLKKSKVESLYNNLPLPLAEKFNHFYGGQRGRNFDMKTYDQFAESVNYAQKKGFKVVYLINSPKNFSEKDFDETKDLFYNLLDFIHDIGIKEIKIANTQVASLINEYKYKFELSASTSFEYHNTLQYHHLVNNYPNMKLFDISINESQNFKFLTSLKKLFPKIKLELMVNEPCIKGCSGRIFHNAVPFKVFMCGKFMKDGPIPFFFKSARIFPWQLEYYSAIGINNFKLVTLNRRADIHEQSSLISYLDCVENGIEGISAHKFFDEVMPPFGRFKARDDVMISDIIQYFPDIRHFIKNGHECDYKCKVSCTYCYDCAKKIQEMIL